MMRWQIEPMPSWAYPETKPAARRRSTFGSSWSATLSLLERELDALDVRGVVAVRVVGSPGDVRLDGMLRASARLSHPGVAVSFITGRHGSLTYPCDTFIAGSGPLVDWQSNVRAIALGLEALRKLDRYGIAGHGEQYAGWRAIEAAPSNGFASTEEAIRWLKAAVEWPEDQAVSLPHLLKRAARIFHPDVTASGFNQTQWDRYDTARQLLTGDGRPS